MGNDNPGQTPAPGAEGSQTPGEAGAGQGQQWQQGQGKGFSQEDFDRRWATKMGKLEKELGMPINDAKSQLQKFQEFQNSQKSEIQQLTEKYTTADKRALDAEMELAGIKAEVLRAKLARETGLDTKWIEDIKGITEDDIKASILSIKKRHGLDKAGGPTPPGASSANGLPFNQYVLMSAGKGGR